MTVTGAAALRGRRALVTGGGAGIGAGIGASIAEALSAAGADVRTIDADASTGADYIVDVSDDGDLDEMFERLDSDLGGLDILVNSVAPGTVDGECMDRVIAAEAAARDTTVAAVRRGYTEQVSMRTLVDPADIAAAVVFLNSDSARFVNGQVVSIDGHTETLRTV